MTTGLAPVGSIGYDAAGFTSITCVRNASRVGDWLSLYMGGNFGVTKAHWQALWDAGKGGMANWERQANQALKGYVDGVACVDSAMRTAQEWGMDAGKVGVVYSGVDFGPTLDQYPVMDEWHRGLVTRSRELGVASPGFYGHAGYGDHLTAQDWWPADATNWQWAGIGVVRSWTTVKQKYGSYTRDVSRIGCSVDENVVVKPLALWTGDGPDIQPEENDLTPEEHQLLADVHSALLAPQPVKDPYGNQLNMLWATLYAADLACRPQNLVASIAAAVVAALPPSQAGSPSLDQITTSFKNVINSTRLTT